MLKKVRDLVATFAVLAVLFGMLLAINPRVRERFGELMQGRDMNSSLGPMGNVATVAMSIGSDYASDNPVLFSFLVVAVVLFMLLLRT